MTTTSILLIIVSICFLVTLVLLIRTSIILKRTLERTADNNTGNTASTDTTAINDKDEGAAREINYRYDEIQMTDKSDDLIAKVIEVIRQNFDNPDFSVEDLSHEVGISRVHLNRRLKELLNTSPSHLIKSMRLKQAAYLLLKNRVNISEVAYRVGFSTHSYFSNSFHEFFGMSPKEFVAKYMNCTDEEAIKKLFE